MKYIFLLTLAAATLIAADATGNWTGTLTPSDGTGELGPTGGAVMRFSLRQDGDEIKEDIAREREGRQQTAKLAVKRDK